MNERIFQAPGRYIQGRGVLKRLPEYVGELGERALVLVTQGGAARFSGVLEAGGDRFRRVIFSGECTMAEIERVAGLARPCGVVAGVGGGKVLDTAKGAAHLAGLPVVVAPTTASSDAPCSALSVVYREDGGLDRLLRLRRNPDLVLADSAVIAGAPPRLFAAGIGDALATCYEMQACWDADGDNFIGGKITLAARAIARQCLDTLRANGYAAYRAVRDGLCTPAVEQVVEANTLLSGVGFESGGVCGAHPINNGLAALPAGRNTYHGEKVAFALLCQLVLAGRPPALVGELHRFLHSVGLPVTLGELGIRAADAGALLPAAAIARGDPAFRALAPRADEADVAEAILAADALGRDFLAAG